MILVRSIAIALMLIFSHSAFAQSSCKLAQCKGYITYQNMNKAYDELLAASDACKGASSVGSDQWIACANDPEIDKLRIKGRAVQDPWEKKWRPLMNVCEGTSNKDYCNESRAKSITSQTTDPNKLPANVLVLRRGNDTSTSNPTTLKKATSEEETREKLEGQSTIAKNIKEKTTQSAKLEKQRQWCTADSTRLNMCGCAQFNPIKGGNCSK